MKNITIIFIVLTLLSYYQASSQKKNNQSVTKQQLRCATMEKLEEYLNQNPAARLLAESNKNKFPETLNTGTPNSTNRVDAIVTIPVVVHIVGSASRVAQVTDADVIWQINKLNEDFSGFNADSTNASLFYGVRGHSEIRFCLAKRDPFGNSTNGINRVITTLTETELCENYDLVKSSASCGADAWNTASYFNIWVTEVGECLLGVAQFPGTGNANEDGIVVAFEGFSNNPAYVNPAFNLGRTVVHETGHYFGLYHIWGDDGTACTQSDFRQLPGACLIAGADIVGTNTNLSVGDTPNQSRFTSGCPAGLRTDVCTNSSPGIQYQNFMDYTNDACYSLFTNLQVKRMQYVLDNCRASLKTSTGCNPPPIVSLDAQITSILYPSAGGSCGNVTSNIFCTNKNNLQASFTPKIIIRNNGTLTITNLRVTTIVDNNLTSAIITNYSGSLANNATVVFDLNTVSANAGSHTLTIYTSAPNGSTDQNFINDTIKTSFIVKPFVPETSEINEGFEGSAFPPLNWQRINPDNSITWQRTQLAGYFSPSSMTIDNFNYSSNNQVDQILLTPYAVDNIVYDSTILTYDFAGTTYSFPGSTSIPLDTLEVMMSTDCGMSYTTLSKKWGNTLNTRADQNTGLTIPFIPNSTEWKSDKFFLSPMLNGAQTVIINFKNTTNYENNIYIDNIRLYNVRVNPNLKAKGVLITPNPFKSNLVIQHYPPRNDIQYVQIINMIGQVVAQRNIGNTLTGYFEMNLAQLQSGIYFVKIQYKDQSYVQKILKTN